jgi:hypothetical protein
VPAELATPTVALADIRWSGHHATYFREFVASLHRLEVFVIALCPRPEDLTPGPRLTTGTLRAPQHSLFTDRVNNDPATTVLRWLRTRHALEVGERRSGRRADLVFFPYLDDYLRFLPVSTAPEILLGRRWSGLYFRNHHLGWAGDDKCASLKRLAKGDRILRSRSALPLVGVLDERFNAELAAQSGRSARQFPDITDETLPTSPTALSETLLAQARGRPIIGLAGSLEKRKGLLTLLRIAEASSGREPWFFAAVGSFMAGTYSAREIAWIEQVRSRLGGSLYLDLPGGHIPDGAEYNAAFQTFDIAWAAYEDFQGSSNTLTKAALFEKPVLASEGECVAARVSEFRLGESFPARDVEAGRAAIRRILAERERGAVPRLFADYRRFHSRPQLDEIFRQMIGSLAEGS